MQPPSHRLPSSHLCDTLETLCQPGDDMQPQLSVRSAKAREIAHRLARREQRTIASIVERALEDYEARHEKRESAAEFLSRLRRECSEDIDLDEVIRANKKPHSGIDL